MAKGKCHACADSGNAVATPTGFSQMSGLLCRLSSGGKTKRSSLQAVMLRMVDDFLILTPSRAAAEAVILRTMQGVVPSLDCPAAPATLLHHTGPCPRLYQARVSGGRAAPLSQRSCWVSPGATSIMIGRFRTTCVRSLVSISSITCNACRLS